MSSLSNFLQSEHVLALLIAILIFITTLFLVVKRWIGFSITLLLLLFSLTAGLLINHQHAFQFYLNPYSKAVSNQMVGEESQDTFQKQVLQAIEDLKTEVSTEKENLQRVMNQVQEIFDSMDAQKQKIQNFIEETHKQFKTDYPTSSSSTTPETTDDTSFKKELNAFSS